MSAPNQVVLSYDILRLGRQYNSLRIPGGNLLAHEVQEKATLLIVDCSSCYPLTMPYVNAYERIYRPWLQRDK